MPEVQLRPRPEPVLLGDRAATLRAELGGAVPALGLLLALGLVFLVAGLRPTTVAFSHDGTAYEASCGIETVVAGSSWDALTTACREGSGLRVLAVAGGAVLVLGALGQLGWTVVRRHGVPSSLRRAMATTPGRIAAVALPAALLVLGLAALLARARADAAVLTGDEVGGGGLGGAVQLIALLVALAALAALLRPRLAPGPVGVAGLAGAAVAAVLLLAAARPVGVEAGSGDGAVRATCGVEVLLAGHPQPSVASACRDAMGGRALAGSAGVLLGIGAVALLWAGRRRDEPEGRPPAAPLDLTIVEAGP